MRTRKRIKCPYCMTEFAVDQLHFRVNTAFSDAKAAEEKGKIGVGSMTPKRHQKLEMIEKYKECGQDKVFLEFWDGFPKKKEEKKPNHPIICPDNVGDMQVRVVMPKGKQLPYLEDYFGERSDIRLCPRCHCELPYGYGMDPAIFVSLLGYSDESIEEFLGAMRDELVRIPEVVDTPLDDGKGYVECAEKNRKFFPPVIFNLRKHEGDRTLVLRAFSEEDCRRLSGDLFLRQCMEKSDKVILLWGREDIGRLLRDDDEVFREMETVIDSLFMVYKNSIETVKRRKKEYAIALAITRDSTDKWEWISEEGKLAEDKLSGEYLPAMLRKIKTYFGTYRFFVCEKQDGKRPFGKLDSVWQWALQEKGSLTSGILRL